MHGCAGLSLVRDTLTEERIILDRGYEVLIVDEERLRSSQVRKVGGGRFLWDIVSHTSF